MAKLSVLAGATSVSVGLFIQDSSSTTGAGLAGLVFNSAGLTCYAVVPGASAAAITLATLAAANSAYSSGGFKEIDATNMPGWYRFDVPNTNISTGRSVGIHFKGATNMAPLPLEIELTGWNNQDGVRGGMTALPNAAAEAAGGLYTRGTGAGQINQPANGSIDSNTKTWNALTTVALPLVPTTAGRTLDVSATGEAGVDWANVGSPTTAVDLSATTIAITQRVDVNTIKTNPVVNAGTITFPTTATLASTTNITAGTVTTATNVTNLTNAPTAGDFTATMKTSIGTAMAASAVASVTGNVGGNVTGSVGSVVGAVGSVTGAVGSVTGNIGGNLVGSVGSLGATAKTDVKTQVTDGLVTDVVADSVPADGSRPSIAQAAYMLVQFMLERSVSGTTMTVKKPDGSTSLFTLTLNDASTPTSITRAT